MTGHFTDRNSAACADSSRMPCVIIEHDGLKLLRAWCTRLAGSLAGELAESLSYPLTTGRGDGLAGSDWLFDRR